MRKEPRALRFWRWVHKYSEKRIMDLWLERHRCDRICPNCKTWNSVIGEWPNTIPNSPDEFHDTTQCKKCEHITVWNMTGIAPFIED